MSEERLERIEAFLATLATKDDIAALRTETKADISALRTETKADISALRAEMTDMRAEMTDMRAEMTDMRAEMAGLRAEMATKSEIASVAKNVDITALGRQLGRISDDITALKDDLAVTTAMAQRIDHITSRLIADVLTEIRAEHSRMDRLLNRVQRLEADALHPEDGG